MPLCNTDPTVWGCRITAWDERGDRHGSAAAQTARGPASLGVLCVKGHYAILQMQIGVFEIQFSFPTRADTSMKRADVRHVNQSLSLTVAHRGSELQCPTVEQMGVSMAPRGNWKGYLKLSLVSCAIALYPATSETTRVRFNTINRKTGNRVKRQFIDPETDEVVDTEDQIKGYAVGKNNFITVEDEELDAIKIESTRTIDIDSFVPQKEIDPGYFDAPYYIAPEDKVSQEAFAVIRDAMRDKKVVGIGRVVLARRERPIMLEPYGRGIRAMTLRYASEVRDAAAYFEDIPDIKLPAEMKELAEVIIDRKAAHFDPAKFEDRYENAVIDLLKTKEAGLPPPAQKPEPRPHNVINIMDALRKSIEAEKVAPSRAVEVAEKRKAPSKARRSAKSQAPAKKRSSRKG